MNNINTFIAFILGAGVGSVATWYFLKDKNEEILNEEKASYKAYYEKKVNELTPDELKKLRDKKDLSEVVNEAHAKETPADFANLYQTSIKEKKNYAKIGEGGYVYAEPGEYNDIRLQDEASLHPSMFEETERPVSYSEEPYVIAPDEFGEDIEYNTISLLYFADGVLTDDDYSIIENVNDIVGEESLKTFGQYENDAVYVRNDRLKCEYEILYDVRNFEDIKLAKLRNGLD